MKNGRAEAGLTGFYDHYAFGLAQQTVDRHHLVGHTGGVSRKAACFQADLDSGFAVIALRALKCNDGLARRNARTAHIFGYRFDFSTRLRGS